LWGFTLKHSALVWPYLPQWRHEGEPLWGYCRFCRKAWWGMKGLELNLPIFGSCFLIRGFWCRIWWQCGLMCPVTPQWWQVGWLHLLKCFLVGFAILRLTFLHKTKFLPSWDNCLLLGETYLLEERVTTRFLQKSVSNFIWIITCH
jgi:hypothetical protein